MNFFEPISTLTVESLGTQVGEQRPRKLLLIHDHVIGMFLAQLAQGRGVTDVDEAEGFVFAKPQGNFAVRPFQVQDVQLRRGGRVEQHLQDVGEHLLAGLVESG